MTNLNALAQKDFPHSVFSTEQAIAYVFLFTFVNVYKILMKCNCSVFTTLAMFIF